MSVDAIDRQADTVQRHRTLVRNIARQALRRFEAHAPVVPVVVDVDQRRHAVDVTRYEMAAERVAGLQRRLQVDRRPGRQPSQRGQLERFGRCIGRERRRLRRQCGQTDAVDRDAVADLQAESGQRVGGDGQAFSAMGRLDAFNTALGFYDSGEHLNSRIKVKGQGSRVKGQGLRVKGSGFAFPETGNPKPETAFSDFRLPTSVYRPLTSGARRRRRSGPTTRRSSTWKWRRWSSFSTPGRRSIAPPFIPIIQGAW